MLNVSRKNSLKLNVNCINLFVRIEKITKTTGKESPPFLCSTLFQLMIHQFLFVFPEMLRSLAYIHKETMNTFHIFDDDSFAFGLPRML
jgi:hypothetical protein